MALHESRYAAIQQRPPVPPACPITRDVFFNRQGFDGDLRLTRLASPARVRRSELDRNGRPARFH